MTSRFSPPIVTDHHDSSRPQRAFVGFFDVLGFKERLRVGGLEQILLGYRQLSQAKMHSGIIPVFSAQGGIYRTIGTTIFSDSILYWCDDNWEGVQTLLAASAHLIASAVDMGWPLRGALAYGDCVLDRESRTFIGQPLIDAYLAEENQRWIGVALHDSVTGHASLGTRIQHSEDVIAYQVPVKINSCQFEHAIHWGPYSTRARVVLSEARRLAAKRKIREYYSNTLRYVSERCQGFHAASRD